MKRLVMLVTVTSLLAGPVGAQSLSVLLPSMTFPDPVATPSTKDCVPTHAVDCQQHQ